MFCLKWSIWVLELCWCWAQYETASHFKREIKRLRGHCIVVLKYARKTYGQFSPVRQTCQQIFYLIDRWQNNFTSIHFGVVFTLSLLLKYGMQIVLSLPVDACAWLLSSLSAVVLVLAATQFSFSIASLARQHIHCYLLNLLLTCCLLHWSHSVRHFSPHCQMILYNDNASALPMYKVTCNRH